MQEYVNYRTILRVKDRANAIQSSVGGTLSYSKALDIASIEEGHNCWFDLQNEKNKLPAYILTVHVHAPYLAGKHGDGWRRLKTDLSWAPVPTCDQQPRKNDFHSTPTSSGIY